MLVSGKVSTLICSFWVLSWILWTAGCSSNQDPHLVRQGKANASAGGTNQVQGTTLPNQYTNQTTRRVRQVEGASAVAINS